jgi:uncharacterized protein YjbI with pentapeptide repeats
LKKHTRNIAKEWDVFISHATEDKDEIARLLAQSLTAYKLEVWFDEFEIKVGDSITEKIEYGLANSNFGIIILSKNFFSKRWPKRERNALLNREINTGRKIILPVWHKVTKEEVANYSQLLVDAFALNTEQGTTKVTEKLVEEIKGRGYLENILRSKKYKKQREDTTSLSHSLFILLKQGKIALFNKKRYQYYRTSLDFHNRNLSNANLQGADLSEVNLRDANLTNADLQYANLYGTSLIGANISRANLSHSALKHANLQEANMENSNLNYAYLDRVDLRNANLTNASLKYISIVCADLRNADINGANFYEAFGLPISTEDAKSRGAVFNVV